MGRTDVDRTATRDVGSLVGRLGGGRPRVLLWGEMGTGKSTLARHLAAELGRRRGGCRWLLADPGSPPAGVPGAVSLGQWVEGGLRIDETEALCSLDAVRFRLPLVEAVRRLLADEAPVFPLVLDPPGVTGGVAGAELLTALVDACKVDRVVALHRPGRPVPLLGVLAGLPVEVITLPAADQARRPPRTERAAHRTRLWDLRLSGAEERAFPVPGTPVVGTPPPLEVPGAWAGRQVAVLDGAGRTAGMGEVIRLEEAALVARVALWRGVEVPRLLVRDAVRTPAGLLETALPAGEARAFRRVPGEMVPPAVLANEGSPPISSHVGWAWATLVGGVFGDPLLHVRLRHRRRSLLFDLGDPGRLAARIAHQVTDVFLTHAHLDHVGGFPWFLRSRLGPYGACRLYGPPGIIDRIGHFIQGITWDRIADDGPVFEVAEVRGDHLRRARLRPGKRRRRLADLAVVEGVVRSEPEFTIRAVVCDHGIPAVAYAFESGREINVRKDRLAARGLPPGPWLGELKRWALGGDSGARLPLPDGTTAPAAEVAEDLLLVRPGKKLAYAADTADTPENRRKLVALAAGAHTFYCEAAFIEADRAHAEATQHLTARAAAEVAREAGAERLAPFHFSRRYEHAPDLVYGEVLAAAGPVRVLGGNR